VTGGRIAWLIDGNNVMARAPTGGGAIARCRAKARRRPGGFAAREGVPVTWCSTERRSTSRSRTACHWTSRSPPAAAATPPTTRSRGASARRPTAALTVVTSDAGLARRVGSTAAEVVPAGRFRRGLG